MVAVNALMRAGGNWDRGTFLANGECCNRSCLQIGSGQLDQTLTSQFTAKAPGRRLRGLKGIDSAVAQGAGARKEIDERDNQIRRSHAKPAFDRGEPPR